MTVMCFLFQELLEERCIPHDNNVWAVHMTIMCFFVSRAAGGRGQST